jgi:Family of unknown function (DUF5678)
LILDEREGLAVTDDLLHEQMDRNRKAYAALRDTILRDHAGKYVALAFGRLIASSPDFDEVMATVNDLCPGEEHVVVFPAGEEPMFEPLPPDTYTELL